MLKEPFQPAETEWSFVAALKAPLWESVRFKRLRPRRNEVSIRKGVEVQNCFPDPDGRLATAHADLRTFFGSAGIPEDDSFPIIIRKGRVEGCESYRIEIQRNGCEIIAEDTEGARRGIYFLQDEMLRTGGPMLPIGATSRKPQIRTRLSRCFFGPINRPPKNRDELMDDVDYYPDEYLNRLAHHGVNGLWLTVNFRDLYPSELFPEFGGDSVRRLEKLRATVRACARYGIKIYVFCLEPKAFGDILPEALNPNSDLQRHPELGGHRAGPITCFCPSISRARAYLEAATHHVFSQVPGLGGLIGIHLGESPTHCCWNFVWNMEPNNCPRCSKRETGKVFRDMLNALWRGMHRASPTAELISWAYVPDIPDQKKRRSKETAKIFTEVIAHFPKKVILQCNFESLGVVNQLGKDRVVRDYSLAYIGPSYLFEACANSRKTQGGRLSAKLQVGCSHEVATVPFVPVPGNLFEKYRAMHRIGVTDAMQSWYFGNYPSLMTKAAGELSFSPLPTSERVFLERLAAINWADDGPVVARAWSMFSEAYREFPANLAFAWYGPVHDAVVWPLHLVPVDEPIAPSWLLGFPPSGDRIGECLGFDHSLEEAIALLESMHRKWSKGLSLLQPLVRKYRHWRENVLEIGVAQAMSVQISSALNVLRFYAEREKFYAEGGLRQRRKSIRILREIVVREIANSEALEKLALVDSRLGFHSEAEGYKYFPKKLRWRSRLLRNLLRKDFPKIEGLVEKRGGLPSPYKPASEDVTYKCKRVAGKPKQSEWRKVAVCQLNASDESSTKGWRTVWQSVHDGDTVYFRIECALPQHASSRERMDYFPGGDYLRISVEPRRFWPVRNFYVGSYGDEYLDNKTVSLDERWRAKVSRSEDGWSAYVDVPIDSLRLSPKPFFRLNIERVAPDLEGMAWIPRHPSRSRLIYEDSNPADLAWVFISESEAVSNN